MFRYSKGTFVREVAMLLVALIMMLPFYILFNTAFKNTEDALSASALALPTCAVSPATVMTSVPPPPLLVVCGGG